MRKFFSLLAIVTLSSAFVQAQTKSGKISGSVMDGDQKTIASATISLMKAADSSAIKYSVADKTGRFEFDNLSAGKYMVSVSAVGHNKGFSEIVELDGKPSAIILKSI